MSQTKLSELLQLGFEDALRDKDRLARDRLMEPALAMIDIRDLPRLTRDRTIPALQRDELVAAVVRCYRRSSSPAWSGVLLEVLAPGLVRVCRRMIRLPRGVESDDVQQQVVLEALRSALTMPLHDPPEWLRRRIELRVTTMTVRWLVSVVRSQGEELVAVDPQRTIDPIEAEKKLLEELSQLGMSHASLALLYRTGVLRQTFAEIAFDLGISPNAAWLRYRRVVRDLRRKRPELFGRLADDFRSAA